MAGARARGVPSSVVVTLTRRGAALAAADMRVRPVVGLAAYMQ
jgi:hypothetical protein